MASKKGKKKRPAKVAKRWVRLREHQYIQRIKLAIIRQALVNQHYREAILSGGKTLKNKAQLASFKVPLLKGVKLKAVAETPDQLYLLVPHDVSDTWLPMALIEDPIIQVTSKAATDDKFRKRLVSRPKNTLRKMFGIKLPRVVKLEVLVDTARLRHVVIPVTGRVRPEVTAYKETLESSCIISPNRTTGPCARNPDLTSIQWCPYPPGTELTNCGGVTTDDDCVSATTNGDCGSVITIDDCGGSPTTIPIDECDFFTLPCHVLFTHSDCVVTEDGCQGLAEPTDDGCGGGGINSPNTECDNGGIPNTEPGCTGTPDQPMTDDQTPFFF